MAGRLRGILEHLLGRRLEATVSEMVTDSELLRRFKETRDEAAFELLVWRYGAMVLGLCRRAVRDEQLAEDAFQAVFLVLARKAGSIRGSNVAGWLFRVARRVAARAARRHSSSQQVPDVPATPEPSAAEHQELTDILDAEVARLPDRLRRAVILCYLGGHTTEDAARELGCPRGTVLSRLAAARKRLAERLTHRGVTLPAVGVMVGERTTGRLVSQTVALAQNPFRIPASTGPALLAESVVRAMATTKLAAMSGAVLLTAGLVFGAGWGLAEAVETNQTPAIATPDAQTGQPPTSAKKEPDSKDAKPIDRAAQLRKHAEEIAKQIQLLEMHIVKGSTEINNTVDVSVLQSELFAVDKEILATEKQARTAAHNLESLTKDPDMLLRRALEETNVLRVIDNSQPVIRSLNNQHHNLEAKFRDLKIELKENDPALLVAMKELADAENALKKAREKARPQIERTLRDSATRDYSARVSQYKAGIKDANDGLSELLRTRASLVERIAITKEGEAKRQVLQDQLRVLREIQLELFRQQTLTELGIVGLQPAVLGSGANTGSDPQIRELQRAIESLRKEVSPESNAKVEAQLKELQQQIETLRTEVQRLKKK